MAHDNEETRTTAHELGEFLRVVRDRLQPEDLGLPAGIRRRAPGLRREEVATLCGISPTWYTWIEQGRTAAISVDTLDRLARGLCLSPAERAYLFELAARTDPDTPEVTDADPQQFSVLVDALNAPAYVLDRYWNALVWNTHASDLFNVWLGERQRDGRGPAGGRNLLRYVFMHPDAKRLIVDWPERSRRLVAEYRADSAGALDDPLRLALLAELCRDSPEFDSVWREQRVLAREGGLRRFCHARQGDCAYRQFTLRVAHHPELKLIVLVRFDPLKT